MPEIICRLHVIWSETYSVLVFIIEHNMSHGVHTMTIWFIAYRRTFTYCSLKIKYEHSPFIYKCGLPLHMHVMRYYGLENTLMSQR